MLGWLLCKLGVHDNMPSHVLEQSTWGYCLRCNKPWQLDN